MSEIGILETDGAMVVALREREDGPVLSLMRTLEPDEQDIALGQAGVCVVGDDGAAVYDGVESWNHRLGVLTLVLTDDAAEVLRVPRELRFETGASDAIDAALGRLFAA